MLQEPVSRNYFAPLELTEQFVYAHSGYVEKGDELSVSEAIERVLTERQENTANFTSQQWDSVFWDPIYAQPEKMTRMLNKVYQKVPLFLQVDRKVYNQVWK